MPAPNSTRVQPVAIGDDDPMTTIINLLTDISAKDDAVIAQNTTIIANQTAIIVLLSGGIDVNVLSDGGVL